MSTPVTGNIQLTAVALSNNPNLVPTGVMVFAVGNRTLGTASLDNTGTASIIIPADLLGPGTWDLVAYYPGDANFAPGTSIPTVEMITGSGGPEAGPFVSNPIVGELNGDVTGLELANVITNLQGNPVGAVSPSTGQVLTWSGLVWAPENPPSGSFAAGGDLIGTGLTQTVAKLQGITLTAPSPINGQVLEFNGSAWVPTTLSSGFIAGGDLTGNTTTQYIKSLSGSNDLGGAITLLNNTFLSASTSQIVLKIDGYNVISSNGSNNLIVGNPGTGHTVAQLGESSTDFLGLGDTQSNVANIGLLRTSNNGSGRVLIGVNIFGYGALSLLSSDTSGNTVLEAPTGSAVIFAVNGTDIFQASSSGIALGTSPSYGSGTGVAFLQNASVNPSTSPSSGALLYANSGGLWIYQSNGANFQITQPSTTSVGGDLTGTLSNPTINKFQGVSVVATGPSIGQVLQYNGSVWAPATITPSGSAGGDLTGTYPNPTIAKLQGITVTASSPSNGQVLEYNGSAWVPATITSSSARAYFGTGADGTHTFDGTSTVLGLVPNGSHVYTLSRNINCINITINSGVTIVTAGSGIFCIGTLTNNGIIDDSGGNGTTGGVAGAGAASNVWFGGGSNGGSSGPTTAGQNYTSNAAGYGGLGGSAGAAAGSLNNAGYTLANFTGLNLLGGSVVIAQSVSTSIVGTIWGGSGGGGGVTGGNTGALAGGGGGGGGGTMVIACSVISGTGIYTAKGGNGANGTANAFPSGGGGGGGGGVIVIVYGTNNTSIVTSVAGGSGGTGGASGGANGNPGSSGNVIIFQG